MKKNNFILSAIALCIAITVSAQKPVQISLVYPLSTNGKQAPEITNGFSLNIIQGVSKNENNFSISGVAGIVKNNASGVQISGVYHHVGNQLDGVQLSGVANYAKYSIKGVQISGVINLSQSAGSQISGIANIAKSVSSIQVTGVINVADTVGTQVAGVINRAKRTNGIQISGVWSQTGEVNTQISGIVNRATKVKGVQLGLLNIADSSDYAIGLINIIKNGEQSLSVSYDESGSTLLSLRSGGGVLYGILGLGYNIKFPNDNIYVAEAGFGAKVFNRESFALRTEIVSQTLSQLKGNTYNKSSLRVLPSLNLGEKLMFFAGPTLNFIFVDNDETHSFVKKTFLKRDTKDGVFASHIGFTAGLLIKI